MRRIWPMALCILIILLMASCSQRENQTLSNLTTHSAVTATGGITGPSGSGTTSQSALIGSDGTSTAGTTIIRYTAATTPFVLLSVERLVARSDDIFIGTVVQVLPTVRIDRVGQGFSSASKPFFTNISSFVFRVDSVIMGSLAAGDQVRMDMHGGLADGISEDYGIDYPKLDATYLMFVYRPSDTQDKAYFSYLFTDTFNSYSEIQNDRLIPNVHATVFHNGIQLKQVLNDVQTVIAEQPRAAATFSKAEVEAAKAAVKAYYSARAAGDLEAMRKTRIYSYNPDDDLKLQVQTTVLALNYTPSDPARTSALIPDMRRNDYANVIVLRADLRNTDATVNSKTPILETSLNRAIILVRNRSDLNWLIANIDF